MFICKAALYVCLILLVLMGGALYALPLLVILHHSLPSALCVVAFLAVVLLLFSYVRLSFFHVTKKIKRQFHGAVKLSSSSTLWVYPSRSVSAHSIHGWRGHGIVLSDATTALPEECVDWIVQHEMAHIVYRDTVYRRWIFSCHSTLRSLSLIASCYLKPLLLIPVLRQLPRLYLLLVGVTINALLALLKPLVRFIDWRVEYRADRYATLRTSPEAGEKALEIIKSLRVGGIDIRTYLGFSSHPPESKRIARIVNLPRGTSS